MSRLVHGFLHALAIVAQYVNVSAIPLKWQPLVAILITAAQGGLALKNHPKD